MVSALLFLQSFGLVANQTQGSPTVYLEQVPGINEVTDAIKAVLKTTNILSFDAVIPNEIGGMNSFEAL
ncbi:uncharacterized protein GLRG_08859 [Colletotrichum graminicola M1.001]|uniref:S-Me-THD N-terminal domain-containing protein n=1 Tax=Colletotrichum graminicola (strain M1.001 / M2 / FGSC 10212) TaxID=645133 RepID=E3QS88_COLGM|nr:uncharacterized protein GLRG_08859 [Colletotrichum graminicola M1.001]EFQ33715.1 hypothetical protein GLRG_08859 [Colletotrichum graminicola M1.001]